VTFLNQTKVDCFGLIPPHINNDMKSYSGHLKTALNSQKVCYAPRVGAGISAEKYDLMKGIQGLRTASKASTVAYLILQVFPGEIPADQTETTCAFVTGIHPPTNPIFFVPLLPPTDYPACCISLN